MTNLPPEVAQARALLRQVIPEQGSKARVYARVMAQAPGRAKLGARLAIVVACLCLSASAMGLGYRLVTRNKTPDLHDGAGVIVPRKQPTNIAAPRDTVATADAPDAPALTKSEPAPATGTQSKVLSALPRRSNSPLQNAPSILTQLDSTDGASELSQQVADYRLAVAQIRRDPAFALEQLKTQRANWPSSAIRHEVDLRIIEALVTLGRRNEAIDAARSFLQQYPNSARSTEVRRIADTKPLVDTIE